MKLSAEISMYPFNEAYIPPIQGFIDWLNQQEGLLVSTKPTCTIVTGDYERVMQVLGEGMRYSVETWGKAVFVTKFLPGFAALPEANA
ncbi:hypothetical protein QWI17_19615 [Gilvimarinus sp. SDUM040013]|uniref:Thiamin/hydroxymethyl pyrimidine-binding YkoF putative domain-containing protein n=1 Tax=Gilvimarinus gilvus TaxID=3058038 RepID=A0ABU4S378_9GAMM|nr:hypothetical protein [Gilvimarinus sp. SDUM040013]MDO3388063.1 hypothetical protein [Gilvimarinus sp. SDUM040013]MDX6850971.1 hypothetical protein [Gilvimarinus sp. SDUM040013]